MAVETVSITAGTTDPIAVDDVGGTLKFQQIKVNLGADGAVGNIWDGKIQGGTIDVGTVAITGNLAGLTSGTINSIPNTPGGTLGLVTRVGNLGTLEVGTVTLTNPTGTTVQFNNGTVDLLKAGTITKLEGGTVGLVTRTSTIGTLEVGTVTITNPTGTTVQFNNGTVDVLKAGTVVVSSLPNITQGSIQVTAGTGIVTGGSIVVTNGTIGSMPNVTLAGGTVQNVVGGTLGLITRVGNIGTLEVGTVTIGAVNSIGTLGTLQLGTVTVTNPTGTTVQFNNGTIDLLKAGTITRLEGGTVGLVSSVTNLAGGTIGILTNGTLSSSGTTTGVGVVSMLSAGTVSMINAGTLTSSGTTTGVGVVSSVTNLAAGTVQSNPKPTIITNTFGTTTTGTIGTLVAAPSAGSAIFVTSLDISAVSGTAEVLVSYGLVTTGNQVFSRGLYPAGGGIAKTYSVPNSGSATGTALTYNILSGSGTIAYTLAYFVAVP